MPNLQSEQTSSKDKEDYLKKCTVAVRKAIGETILGTGFITTQQGIDFLEYKDKDFLNDKSDPSTFWENYGRSLILPPIEYNKIEDNLKDNRRIFITGSPEYGKTYITIRILWKYYKDGYTSKFIEEGSKDTNEIIIKLVNQDKSFFFI